MYKIIIEKPSARKKFKRIERMYLFWLAKVITGTKRKAYYWNNKAWAFDIDKYVLEAIYELTLMRVYKDLVLITVIV